MVVGFGRFHRLAELRSEPGPDSDWIGDLPYSEARVLTVAAALRRAGVTLSAQDPHVDPTCSDFAVLLREVAKKRTGSVVVHLLSHGRVGRTGQRLFVVTGHPSEAEANACEVCDEHGWKLSEWIADVEEGQDGPNVLLLLDLCSAGTAIESQWRPPKSPRRVWILGATAGGDNAYGGFFSVAVADVLEQLAVDGLGTHEANPVVETHVVARRIRHRLAFIVNRPERLPQELVATPTVLGGDVPAFFSNVNFRAAAAERARMLREVDAGLAEIVQDLDPGLDAEHFVSRAMGRRPHDAAAEGSLFVGRDSVLIRLTDWIEQPEVSRPADSLAILTGSPGTGKSSVLGMLVCAAHPQLRRVRPALGRPRLLPRPQESFAAAHARSRDQNEISRSLASQLGLPEPAEGWTASSFLQALDGLAAAGEPPPVLVIDAVDEARSPRDLVDLLLLPLIGAVARPGTGISGRRTRCRLLVGVRPWHDLFGRFFELGKQLTFVDLDDTSMEELRHDLETYATTVLSAVMDIESAVRRREREELARAVADRLTGSIRRDGQNGAGLFLLASISLQHIIASPEFKSTDHFPVDSLVVPASLEWAMEVHLSQLGAPRLRYLLAAFAFAKGDGLPAELAEPVAEGLAQVDRATVEPEGSFTRDLDLIRFYLRSEQDVDGTTLYRLYHERLAEYLRSRSPGTGASRER